MQVATPEVTRAGMPGGTQEAMRVVMPGVMRVATQAATPEGTRVATPVGMQADMRVVTPEVMQGATPVGTQWLVVSFPRFCQRH